MGNRPFIRCSSTEVTDGKARHRKVHKSSENNQQSISGWNGPERTLAVNGKVIYGQPWVATNQRDDCQAWDTNPSPIRFCNVSGWKLTGKGILICRGHSLQYVCHGRTKSKSTTKHWSSNERKYCLQSKWFPAGNFKKSYSEAPPRPGLQNTLLTLACAEESRNRPDISKTLVTIWACGATLSRPACIRLCLYLFSKRMN